MVTLYYTAKPEREPSSKGKLKEGMNEKWERNEHHQNGNETKRLKCGSLKSEVKQHGITIEAILINGLTILA